jgi:hypothetical protein
MSRPLLAAAGHCSAKVTDRAGGHGSLVALALEVDGEGHERHAVRADSVESAVAALSGHGDVHEACFAEQALSEALEPVGREL